MTKLHNNLFCFCLSLHELGLYPMVVMSEFGIPTVHGQVIQDTYTHALHAYLYLYVVY